MTRYGVGSITDELFSLVSNVGMDMTIDPPSLKRTRELLAELGIDASEETARQYRDVLTEGTAVYERLADLDAPDELRPDEAVLGRRSYDLVADDDDPLNAWVAKTEIEGDADGILSGYDVGVKDNVAVAGLPLTSGSTLLADYEAQIDATVVTRLLEAGGTIVGTLSMDSFAFSGVGDTSDYGPMRNPHDRTRLAGGSSGGSAAAVANGDVDIALGADQGGSIRVPASWCGVVGHKPTHGLVPYTGIVRVDNTLDIVGPIGQRVVDVARGLEAIAGPDSLDPRQASVDAQPYGERLDSDLESMTVGVLEEGFAHENLEAGVESTVRTAVDHLATRGATVRDVSVPLHLESLPAYMPLLVEGSAATAAADGLGFGWEGYYNTHLAEAFGKARRQNPEAFSFNVKAATLLARYVTEDLPDHFYGKAQNLRRRFRAAYDEILADVDLLALPTTPQTAMAYDSDASEKDRWDHAVEPSKNTYPFNITGHPAVSVPCGRVEGLPVGLMLVGSYFDDATVLSGARAVERVVDSVERD